MTKKSIIKSFLKGKAFYVILFICLCIVGTTAVITTRSSMKGSNKQASNLENKENKEIAQNENNLETQYKDAELVEEKTAEDKQEFAVVDGTEDDDTVQTSSNPSELFISPITNGVVTRNYDITPRLNDEKTSAVVYKGVDIESKVGTDVKSIANGKVIDAGKGDSKEGFYVVVQHNDGFISSYGNLAEDLAVTVGDEVTQGSILGKIGNTIQNNPSDRVSEEYLLFHMEKSKEPINPIEYIHELKVE